MIEFATKEMIPDMVEIWEECFGDNEDYIRFFFDKKLIGKEKFENQLVWLEENKPVAMLTMLESKVMIHKKQVPMWYIYAVATKSEFRKRGIAGKLVDYANEIARKKDGITALVPASDKLFHYYEKLGYQTVFQVREWKGRYKNEYLSGKSKEGEELVLDENLTSEEFKTLRNHAFGQEGFVFWDEEAILYALEENKRLGGKNYKIAYKQNVYFLMCCLVEGCLIIRETSIPEELIDSVVALLSRKLSFHSVKITVPNMNYHRGKIRNFGMARGKRVDDMKKIGYLGLALD